MTVPLCMISDTEYKTNFHTQLKVLQQESAHTDATLNIGDFHICCHKIVLCAASPYFKSIFATGSVGIIIVYLIYAVCFSMDIILSKVTVSSLFQYIKCQLC